MALTVAQIQIAVSANVAAAQAGLQQITNSVNQLSASIAGLGPTATASLNQLNAGLRATGNAFVDMGRTGVEAITSLHAPTNTLSAFMERATERAIGWSAAMVGLRVIETVFTGINSVVYEFNAQMQMAEVSWKVLLGSQQLAVAALSELQQFAAKTIFEFPQIEQSARQLMGFGFTLKEVLKLIPNIGAVSSLAGDQATQSFGRIAYAIGQIRNEGRVLQQDLHQLIQAGVEVDRIYEIIAQKQGTSIGAVRQLQREGKLSSDVFIEAFNTFVEKNYADIIEQQSRTAGVAFANIRDQVRITFGAGFNPVFEGISKMAVAISDFVSTNEFFLWGANVKGVLEFIGKSLDGFVEIFAKSFEGILSVVERVGGLILKAFDLINPWIRHSPSLVESVETGLLRITEAFDALGRDAPIGLEQLGAAITHFRQAAESGLDGVTAKADAALTQHLALIGAGVPAAYRAAEAEIKNMRIAAAEMSDEIIGQASIVRDLKEAWIGWKEELATVEAQIHQNEQRLQPFKDAVVASKDAMLDARIELAQSEIAYYNASAGVRSLEQSIKDIDIALTSANASVKEQEAAINAAQSAIRAWGQEAVLAQAGLDPLSTSFGELKDKISSISDQLSSAKAKLHDLVASPLEGEKEMADSIFQAEIKLARAQLALKDAQSRGVKGSGLDQYHKQVDQASAALERLQLQQKIEFEPKHKELKEIANPLPELNFEDAKRQIGEIGGKVSDLTKLHDGLVGIRDLEQERLRGLTDELKSRQLIVTNIQATKDGLVVALDLEKQRIQPMQTQVELARQNLATATLFSELAEADLAVQQRGFRDLVNQATDLRDRVKDSNAEYTTANQLLTDLKTAQRVLITQANDWTSELKNVAREATAIFEENERERKKRITDRPTPGERSGGFDPTTALERLELFEQRVTEVQAQLAEVFGPSLEYINSQFSTFAGWITQATDALQPFLDSIQESLDNAEDNSVLGFIRLIIAQIPAAIFKFIELRVAVGLLAVAFGIASGIIGAVLGTILSPLGLLVAALAVLTVAWEQDWGGIQEITADAIQHIIEWFQSDMQPLLERFGAWIQSDFLPALSAIGAFILDEVVPALGQFAAWLGENVVPALGVMKDFIGEEVLPRLGMLKDFIGNDVIPQLGSLKDWIIDTLIPALGEFKDFIGEHILPKLGALKDFIGEHVIPRLGDLKDWFGENILPAMGAFKDFIGSDIIPALRSIKDWIGEHVLPKLGGLKDFLIFDLIPGLGKIKDFLVDNVLPKFKDFGDGVKRVWDMFVGFNQFLKDVGATMFNAVMTGLKIHIQAMIVLINTLIEGWNAWGKVSEQLPGQAPFTPVPLLPVPGLANGTNSWRGGLALVGERGPEIVNLPVGASVIPNSGIAGSGTGGLQLSSQSIQELADVLASAGFQLVVNIDGSTEINRQVHLQASHSLVSGR